MNFSVVRCLLKYKYGWCDAIKHKMLNCLTNPIKIYTILSIFMDKLLKSILFINITFSNLIFNSIDAANECS